MGELRRSSGELVGMMGGSAGPSRGVMWLRCARPFGHPAAWAWGRHPHHGPVGYDGCVVDGVWSEVAHLSFIEDKKSRLVRQKIRTSDSPTLFSKKSQCDV